MKYDKKNPFSSVNIRLVRHIMTHPAKIFCALRIWTGAKRYAKSYFDKRSEIAGPPITIIIRITNRCNMRCIQCGQWGENGVYKGMDDKIINKELTTDVLRRLIKRVAVVRPFISFFGGEPTLRDDLPELVALASSRHLLTTMNTNGLLLEKTAADLVRFGLTYCKISLDGPRGTNERIRQADAAFDRTMAGIRALVLERKKRRSATPVIQICTTITEYNQKHLVDIAKIVDETGADVFALLFGIFTTPELARATDERMMSSFSTKTTYWPGFIRDMTGIDCSIIKMQVEEIKKRRWNFKYRQYPDDTSVFDIERHFKRPEKTHGSGNCMVPWFRMQILPNGDVAMCEDTPDYIAGNILEKDVFDIWNNERYRNFRRDILTNGIFPACPRCSALYEIPHYSNDSRLVE